MGKRLLIVDDSIFIWQEMKRLLADSDYEIIGCVKTGEEALAFFEKNQPDLVTMDIILPGMDGIEAARLLLQSWPHARVVFVSSLAYDETMDEAKGIGVHDFVFKPFERSQIIEVLDRAANAQLEVTA